MSRSSSTMRTTERPVAAALPPVTVALYRAASDRIKRPQAARGRPVRRLHFVATMRFVALCAAVALERLLELRWSARHLRRLERKGGRVVKERAFPAEVALHAAAVVAAPLEAHFARGRRRPVPTPVRALALAVFAGATLLR